MTKGEAGGNLQAMKEKGSPRSSTNCCCDMSVKCRCQWRWDAPTGLTYSPSTHPHPHSCLLSSTFLFFLACFLLFGTVAVFFAWLTFPPFARSDLASPTLGCQEDNEGSWAIGVYYGDSPFSLHPIEQENMWSDRGAAWPIANPVLTCASVSDASHPSNFVADPFLFIQGSNLYAFFETKNAVTMQGDIGVALSVDGGGTWRHLGIALDEEWHLSFPYVFEHDGQIYMMPEGREKGELRLYRALNFPLEWTMERVLVHKPLVDATMVEYNGLFWLFASDFDHFRAVKNGELEIWHAKTPLGPWRQHKSNPIYNRDKSMGARNGGRPFIYKGQLYRVGQDCGETYGRRVRVFKVETLTHSEYREVEVPMSFEESRKGRNAWNGLRYHHMDVQKLPSGQWIALMDGDRVPSGDVTIRYLFGTTALCLFALQIFVFGVSLGVLRFPFPLSICSNALRRSDASNVWLRYQFSSRLNRALSRLHRSSSIPRRRVKYRTCASTSLIVLFLIVASVTICFGVKFFFGGNGAEEAYVLRGQYSQFTMLTMTYEARLWNLKMYVKHYSRCASVREIVVVWNKGQPPSLSEFDSAVPVRIRVEANNSLNNRFQADPEIKTRAVFELDDDIMMTCDDVERAFKAWREHPDRIVGFYPRLIDGSPLKYRNEKYARNRKGYNMILTGAAFMDMQVASAKYWSPELKQGRDLVHELFNCEDIFLNFIMGNSSLSRAVEYIHPAWAIDTSKLSSAAISRDTKVHYMKRTSCLLKFSELYGGLPLKKWEFGKRKDGWDY